MELIADYINYLEINQVLSFNSLRLYKRDLLDFENYCLSHYGNNLDIKNLSPEMLNQFSNSIIQEGRTTATVNRKLTAIHGFWKWMREQNMVHKDPFSQIQRESQFRNKTITFLSEEEIVEILDCSEHDLKTKIILELIYATGIRVSELSKLTIDDIDLDSQMITIAKSSRFKERVIPFNELLADYIKSHIQEHNLRSKDKLIQNRVAKGVSEREIFRLIRQAAQKAGIQKQVTPSILRNSFLKHLKSNGAHETLLKDLTGQKHIKV
jgi:integrase/recombinase XerD